MLGRKLGVEALFKELVVPQKVENQLHRLELQHGQDGECLLASIFDGTLDFGAERHRADTSLPKAFIIVRACHDAHEL